MKILKFGGKSLSNEGGLKNVLEIITKKIKGGEKLAIVVSARGNATDELENILEIAAAKGNYKPVLEAFKQYQIENHQVDFSEEFETLDKLYEGISLIGDYSDKTKDQVLSIGEVLSAKLLTTLLKEKGIKANFVDTRLLIKTDSKFGNAQPLEQLSKKNVKQYFQQYNGETVNIVTGFIGSNVDNYTTTLGRNGSNYTASLLANCRVS